MATVTSSPILFSSQIPCRRVIPEKLTLHTSQEISYLLQNMNVHYSVCKSSPVVPIPSQMNPISTFPTYFHQIHFNIILHLCLSLVSSLFPSRVLNNILYACLSSSTNATFSNSNTLITILISFYLTLNNCCSCYKSL